MFKESRQDKVNGVSKKFKGHFLNEIQRENYFEQQAIV